jgi:predicted XRE-type DNA-binding protein
MITKQEFNQAAEQVRKSLVIAMPKMITYKSYVQRAVLNEVTQQELEDVRDCRINQGMIDKLTRIAASQWRTERSAFNLYCAAMAVATIVKEYDWGIQYLTSDGLYQMAERIYNS